MKFYMKQYNIKNMSLIKSNKLDIQKICEKGKYLDFLEYIRIKKIKHDIDYLYELTYESYNSKRNILESEQIDDYVSVLKKLIDLGARPKTSNEFYGYFYRKLLGLDKKS